MNIGIDIDDTISNTHDVLFSYAQKYTVEELKREIKEPKESYLPGNGYIESFHEWSDEEADNFWNLYYGEVLKNVTPKSFAKETIRQLKEMGHKIYLVTARFELQEVDTIKLTENWLKENGIEYDYLIFNARDKVVAIKENNIDMLIDDAVSNCIKVSEAGIKTYMMDSIENRGYNIPNVKRLYSWIHAEQEIKKEPKRTDPKCS